VMSRVRVRGLYGMMRLLSIVLWLSVAGFLVLLLWGF